MKMIILAALAWSTAVCAGQSPKIPATFDVACKTLTSAFSLHFQSKSGDVTNDDMQITLIQNGKKLILPLKPGWYEETGAIRNRAKLKRICRIVHSPSYDYDYPAFAVSPTQVLIFFSLNSRPGFSHAAVVLYDTRKERVLDVQQEIASIKEQNMAFRSIPHGVAQRLIKTWLNNTGCDCAESAIEDWDPIQVSGNKIRIGWRAKLF